MPNVRKKDKKLVSAWVSEKLHANLKHIATEQGRSTSEVIDELLTNYANNHPLILMDARVEGGAPPTRQPVSVKYRLKPKRRTNSKISKLADEIQGEIMKDFDTPTK